MHSNTSFLDDPAETKRIKAEQHIRVVHIFDKHYPYGGVTIAYRPERHDSSGFPTGKFASVSVAYCNPSDRYSRRTGEAVAIGNLISGSSILMPVYFNGHPVRNLIDIFTNTFDANCGIPENW